MGLFQTPTGEGICDGVSTSGGGGGGGSTGVSGTVSAIVIVDPSGSNNPWDGRVIVRGSGGDLSSTGGSLVVHISNPGEITGGNGTSYSSVSVSGLHGSGGSTLYQANLSSVNGVAGLIVFNANESGSTGTGGAVTVSNKVGVSGYDSADVKITLDGETVAVTDNGGSLTVDGTIGVSGYNSADVKVTLDSEIVAVSGYNSADVKITLDGETVPVTDNGGSLTVDGIVGVSGYNSADVKVTLDGETIGVSLNGGTFGVSGYDSADVKVTLDGESVTVNNVSLSGAVSGTAPGGINASSVNVSSIGGVVGLIVYNANEQSGGSTVVNINKVGVSSIDPGVNIGVSGYNSADVKVTLDGETIPVTDNGGSLTVDGTVGVSGYNSADVKVTLDSEVVGVSGYNTADVKVTLDGEGVSITGSVPVIDNEGSLTVDGTVGVSGYNSADVKVTLDGETVPVSWDSAASVEVNLTGISSSSLPGGQVSVRSSSGLNYAYVALSAAGSFPVSNATLVDAPGAGYKIVVYNAELVIYGTGTVTGALFLTDGNDTIANRLVIAISYATAIQHIVSSNFHGVSLSDNTALKYSATESTTNAFGHIVVWYRVLKA
jgi:hypothetical protein